MVLVKNDSHHPYYTRSDLDCMNMLLRPIWVFDIDNRAMFWANNAALENVWNAETLDELIQRDFSSDMSEAAASFLADVKNKVLQDPYHASITEQWTFYPRGGEHATTFDITCSGVMIGDTDGRSTAATTSSSSKGGRIAMLVEAEMLQNERNLDERMVRSIELLKHIPVAVSQFTMDGTKLIYQNPKASQLFGTLQGQETSTTDLNYSSEDLNVVSDTNESNDEPVVLRRKTQQTQTLDETQQQERPQASVNELLERFVDTDLGKNAIATITENDEEFSAEVQQYTTTTGTTKASEEPFHKRRHSKDKNNTQQQQQQQQHRWFNVSLRKTRDPVTSDFVILYIARDISDIVKARKDSLRAAMKSEFLDVMAHEIRTPLHQIVGHTDLLEDTSSSSSLCTGGINPLNSEQLASVRQIQSSCSMLISIINDLLDCSKLENGQVLKEDIQFDLDSLLSSCIESMRPQLQNKKGLQLSYHINAKCDTTKLISDPSRLRQILHNLLSNAIKFSSVGSVTVTVKPYIKKYVNDDTDDPLAISESSTSIDTNNKGNSATNHDGNIVQHLLFEVTDTGIGIAATEQSIVFERYRQANASVARTFGGTGLGLPICKGLVELLGGTIGLHSKYGVGTTVYFDIPFKTAQNINHIPEDVQTQTIDQITTQHESSMTITESEKTTKDMILPPCRTEAKIEPIGLSILVVEDNTINQKVVNSMLQRLGHVVSIAENGESALKMIRQKQFQLILMDIQMPIMDGIECTKYIRNVLKYDKQHLPIIGLTAGYQPTDRDYYENDVGMNCCIGKPLPMNKLKETIDMYYCRQPIQQNTIVDLSNNTCIVAIDADRHGSNLSLSTSMTVSADRTPLIATLKRELEVSTPRIPSRQSISDLDSEKLQQQQSNGMLEPANKKKR